MSDEAASIEVVRWEADAEQRAITPPGGWRAQIELEYVRVHLSDIAPATAEN